MSEIKIIGKSTLGELGFCQSPSKMRGNFQKQWEKIEWQLPETLLPVMTSMTNFDTREETKGAYVPKVLAYDSEIWKIFDPVEIYRNCEQGLDNLRPGADFIVSKPSDEVVLTTFSREAPILAFEDELGNRALGTILRGALEEHGEYLFKTIQKGITGKELKVTLVSFNYSHPKAEQVIQHLKDLAEQFQMEFVALYDSETEKECYKHGEIGNHIAAMW